MGHLTNNALRTKNMMDLLNDMGVNLKGTQVICHNELMVFTSNTQQVSEQLAINLNDLLTDKNSAKLTTQKFSLADLITQEVNSGICEDLRNKLSCDAILKILINDGLKYELDENNEHINIELPSAVYAPLFASLKYRYLSVSGTRLQFNIKDFLLSYPNELILIEGKAPLLFTNANVFENKKVFYAKKQLEHGEFEVKPYFYIPKAVNPPEYHFILDTSSSMYAGMRLDTLKESVIKFAEALFEFHPRAIINITQFDTEVNFLNRYDKNKLSQLKIDVNALYANGTTALYQACQEQLDMITQSNKHNNVLLFTDGKDCSINNVSEQKLTQLVSFVEKGNPLVKARNKFFIISYGVEQPQILHRVTKLFNSPVIDSQNADFIKALSDVQQMQTWAATRDLFTCQLVIDNKLKESICSYDMSGQFVALESQRSKDGQVHLKIIDSYGKVILDDKRSLIPNEEIDVVKTLDFDALALSDGKTVRSPVAKSAENTTLVTPTHQVSQSLEYTLWNNNKNAKVEDVGLAKSMAAYNSL